MRIRPRPTGVEPAAPYGLAYGLLRAMRPRQWVKNVFVFAGVVFAVQLDTPRPVLVSVAAFAIFCALSSAAYLINDVLDMERDRLHPKKATRPIAAGVVPRALAVAVAAVLAITGLGSAVVLDLPFAGIALGYTVLTLGYSLVFKHIVLVDVMALALGYVARAAAGAIAIDVAVSPWLLLMTILLALFIGLTKRRHELIFLQDTAAGHRKILQEYSGPLLDQLVGLVSAATLVSYALYTVFSNHHRDTQLLVFTYPFVIYGLFRYLYLAYHKGEGGSPEELVFSDVPLLACVVLWSAAAVAVLYWP